MGKRRGRFEANESDGLRQMRMAEVDRDRNEEEDEVEVVKGFFACYLLCSLSPRHKGHTYIGFTVNPRRRIKQHNGEKRCGAWRTKRGRPWEMAMCIYGFSSNVAALQFEWAWQHPTESLAVRKAAATFKSLSGVANKIKLAYTMLTLPSWENLNLTVNFFSTKYTIHAAGCPRLPAQMRVNICTLDELPCYAEGQGATCKKGHIEEEDDGEELITGFIEVATDHFGQPLQAKETMEELCYFTHSPDRNIASASSTPSSCNEDGGMGKLRPVSSTAELIDLCTPLSCILRTKTKRALFDSEIIDLTDSPLSIQL